MNTTVPLVSIVIPCFNQGKYLAEAIESALAQTHPRCEIVVIDDGSTDMTPAVAARYPEVQYQAQTNSGVSVARNRGLELSRGGYVIFLDADDRLLPKAVETGLAVLQSDSEAAFAYGRIALLIDGQRHPTFTVPPIVSDPYREMLGGKRIWCPGSVLYRREAVLEAGGFPPGPAYSNDLDLYLRITRRRRILAYDTIVVEYRFHAEGQGRNSPFKIRQMMRTMVHQWPIVVPRPWLWLAWVRGVHVCLDYYRGDILHAARTARCRGDRQRFRALLPLVVRFFPLALPSVLRPVRRSNPLTFVVGEAVTPDVETLVVRGRLKLVELHPPATRPGHPFNRQPDGSSALAIRCEGARPGAVVFFDGKALETMYGSSTLLTAVVPEELYREEGAKDVFVRSL